jgi:ribosomal protein L20A (L18A)
LAKDLKGNMKLKYKVNQTRVRYNNKTGMYETGSQTFARYEQAKENRWTCEKCFSRFATLKKLKQHKIDYHAY